MQSLRELYKIGIGPSSSHTYGPMKIAERIKSLYPDMEKVHVDLYGSLRAVNYLIILMGC